MWKMILVFVLVVLLESVASYEGNKPSAASRASPPLLVASATSSDATSRVTTAKEPYNWSPRDPGDTLWFSTNGTGVILTLRYKGPNNNFIQFTPSYYRINEINIWHRIVYKAEPGNKLTICPDHTFAKSIKDPEIDPEISFKHATGFVKWSTSIPDLKTAIKIGPEDIKNYTGEYELGDGPEKLFGVSGKWRPTGLTKGYNNWSVTVDLREIYTITKISLKLQGNGRTDVKTFKLEVSNVWGPLTEIFREDTVKTGLTETQGFPLPSGSSGRFCRFTVTETVTGDAPVIQDLSFYGFTECKSSINDGTGDTTEVSTLVYSSTPQSTWECHVNKSIDCHIPPGETEVCETKLIETCSDMLVCNNVTTSVCKSHSNDEEKVCEDSTDIKCKTSTKDFFDEDGCASLLTAGSGYSLASSDHSSSGLYTSIVFNILLVLVIAILAYLLYAQTGCICNKHNYRKQSLFFEPPAHSPTPPPIRNPILDRMAGIGLDNHASRQSEHLYDAPNEYRERMDMKVPEEVTIRENPTSNRGSTHDSVNSFYAAVN